MVTSLQKPNKYTELQEAVNFPVNELMLPNEYTEYEYRPFITPTSPDYYGQSYWRDMVDHWTLQWQGAVQYGLNNEWQGIFEHDNSWNALDENSNPYFKDLEKYEQHIEDLAMTRSQQHFEYVRGRLDDKNEAKKRLEYSDRWSPGFLTGMANPLYLIPLPSTLGVGIGRGLLKAGGMMAGIMSAEEMVYHTFDQTRTAKESSIAIGSGTIIGGIIGGAFGAFGKGVGKGVGTSNIGNLSKEISVLEKEVKRLDNPWGHKIPPKEVAKQLKATKKELAKKKKQFEKESKELGESNQFNSKVVDDIGKKYDGEHAKIEGKVGSPWDDSKVLPHSKTINKKYTLSYVEKFGDKLRVVFDAKRIMTMFNKGDRFWTQAKYMGTKRVFANDTFSNVDEVLQFTIERAWAKNKFKIRPNQTRSAYNEMINDYALARVKGRKIYNSKVNESITPQQGNQMKKGMFNIGDALGVEKFLTKFTPFYRGINIIKKGFGGDNYLASKVWELSWSGVRHAGILLGVARPNNVESMAKHYLGKNKVLQDYLREGYAKFTGNANRRTVLDVEVTNTITDIGAKYNQIAGNIGKSGGGKPKQPITFNEFQKKVFHQIITPKDDADDVIKKVADRYRKFFREIGEEMSDKGMFASEKGIAKQLKKVKGDIESLRLRYNALGKEMTMYTGRGQKILKPLRERLKAELDDLRAYEKELIDYLETGKANGFKDLLENYFPRMWNLDAITKYPDAFKRIIFDYYKKNPFIYVNGKRINLSDDIDRIQKATDKTYDDIVNQAKIDDIDGSMAWLYRKKGGGNGVRYLKSRNLRMDNSKFIIQLDNKIVSFIQEDVEGVTKAYISRLSPMIAMADKFGDRFMAGEIRRIIMYTTEKYINPALKKGQYSKAKKYSEDLYDYLDEIKDLRDKVLMQFNLADPTAIFERGVKVVKNWTALAIMGSVIKTAILDAGRPIMMHGFKNTFGTGVKGLLASTKDFKMASKMISDEVGESLDVVFALAQRRFVEAGGDIGGISGFERVLNKNTGLFYVANLLAPWTKMLKDFTGVLGQHRMVKHSLEWSKGTLKTNDMKWLLEVGIDYKKALRIVRELDAGNIQRGDNIFLMNTMSWNDKELAHYVRSHLSDEIVRTIVTPRAADRPNIMDGVLKIPLGRTASGQQQYMRMNSSAFTMPFQFLSYGMSATSKIMLAGMQRRDAATMSGLVAMMTLGYISARWRDPWWDKKTFTEQTIRVIELTGTVGILNDMNIMLETLSGGHLGLRPAFGARPLFGEVNLGDRMGEPFGPGINLVTEAIWSMTSEDATKNDRAAIVRRLIPWNNLWVWKEWFRQASQSVYGSVIEKG